MTVQLKRRLITVDEYHKMGEVGILQESGIELINGEIIEMSPIGGKHITTINKLNKLLSAMLGDRAIVSIQNPIIAADMSEPEPDISVLKFKDDFYGGIVPKAKDVLLVIEIADSTLDYDREVKLPIYAEADIPEYWLINLVEKVIEVYSEPSGKFYKLRTLFTLEDTLISKQLNIKLSVQSILGNI